LDSDAALLTLEIEQMPFVNKTAMTSEPTVNGSRQFFVC
jgi:hypothetical protein